MEYRLKYGVFRTGVLLDNQEYTNTPTIACSISPKIENKPRQYVTFIVTTLDKEKLLFDVITDSYIDNFYHIEDKEHTRQNIWLKSNRDHPEYSTRFKRYLSYKLNFTISLLREIFEKIILLWYTQFNKTFSEIEIDRLTGAKKYGYSSKLSLTPMYKNINIKRQTQGLPPIIFEKN